MSLNVIDNAASGCGTCQTAGCSTCGPSPKKDAPTPISRRELAHAALMGTAAAAFLTGCSEPKPVKAQW